VCVCVCVCGGGRLSRTGLWHITRKKNSTFIKREVVSPRTLTFLSCLPGLLLPLGYFGLQHLVRLRYQKKKRKEKKDGGIRSESKRQEHHHSYHYGKTIKQIEIDEPSRNALLTMIRDCISVTKKKKKHFIYLNSIFDTYLNARGTHAISMRKYFHGINS